MGPDVMVMCCIYAECKNLHFFVRFSDIFVQTQHILRYERVFNVHTWTNIIMPRNGGGRLPISSTGPPRVGNILSFYAERFSPAANALCAATDTTSSTTTSSTITTTTTTHPTDDANP